MQTLSPTAAVMNIITLVILTLSLLLVNADDDQQLLNYYNINPYMLYWSTVVVVSADEKLMSCNIIKKGVFPLKNPSNACLDNGPSLRSLEWVGINSGPEDQGPAGTTGNHQFVELYALFNTHTCTFFFVVYYKPPSVMASHTIIIT